MKARKKYPTGFLALLIGFVFLAGGLFVALQPDEFEAVVRINPAPNATGYIDEGEYFLLVELEAIRSRAVLGKVVSQNLTGA